MNNNSDEIFTMNREVYTKLASYNNNYHLHSTNCVSGDNNDKCKQEGVNLEIEYQALEYDMNKLLQLLNNNKIISSTNNNNIDIAKKIEQNNILRAKLQTQIDNLYLDKKQIIRPELMIESGLLWVLLTTSCVYYILVKL